MEGQNSNSAGSNDNEIVRWALSQKGEGSITRVWNAAKKARSQGKDDLSGRLADIARGKAAYAKKMKEQEAQSSNALSIAVDTILGIFR